MPIYVNMPGGGLAAVGQGLAASQEFRANEQRIQEFDAEAARREEAFQLDRGLALRQMEMKEQEQQFEMQQAQQERGAVADHLWSKYGISRQERELISRMSPRHQAQAMEEHGRMARQRAEQRAISEIAPQLEDERFSDIAEKMQAGEYTSAAQVQRAVAKRRREITAAEQAMVMRDSTAAQWEAWKGDPSSDFMPPPPGHEDYDDYMDLIAKLGPEYEAKPDEDYQSLLEDLKFLSSPRMQDAARRRFEREQGMQEGATLDVMDTGDVLEQVKADPSILALGMQDDYAANAKADREASLKAAEENRGKQPSSRLDEPAGLKRNEEPDTQAKFTDLYRKAMNDLGFTEIPQEGEKGYTTALKVAEAVRKKLAEKQEREDAPRKGSSEEQRQRRRTTGYRY